MSFTDKEVYLICSVASHNYYRLERLPKKERSPKEVAETEFLEEFTAETKLSRAQNKLLQRMINDRIANDRNVTLPAYDKRIADNPQDAARYAPYIKRLEDDIAVHEALLQKIAKAL